MLISSREAADLLAPLGLGRESVRRALEFGLAGPVHATRSARLYERDRVADLLDWPVVRDQEVVEPALEGVFVPRLGNHFGTFEEAASGPWRISPWLRARMAITMDRRGCVPLVATIGGFVVLGRDIVGGTVHDSSVTNGRQPGRTCTFTVTDPGPWFTAFDRHRLPTGPGSAWRWWQPRSGHLPALQE